MKAVYMPNSVNSIVEGSHQNVGKVASSIGHEDVTVEEDQEVKSSKLVGVRQERLELFLCGQGVFTLEQRKYLPQGLYAGLPSV